MFQGKLKKVRLLAGGLAVLLPFLVLGCGSGSSGGSDSSTSSSAVSGTGNDGPIAMGDIVFYNNNGTQCGTGSTGEDAQYSISIPSTCAYPVHLKLTGGYDLATGDYKSDGTGTAEKNLTEMHSIIQDSSSSTVNISPVTTLIYHAAVARSLRGTFSSVSHTDITSAISSVLGKFGFGMDTDFNPLTTPIDADNVVLYTKANEGIIEMIRRSVKDENSVSSTKIAALFQTLGADISDGDIDGAVSGTDLASYKRGDVDLPSAFTDLGNPTSKEIVATAELQSAIVAVEVITNSLKITKPQDGSTIAASTLLSNLGKASATVTSKHTKKLDATTAEGDYEKLKIPSNFVSQAKASLDMAISLAGSLGIDVSNFNSLRTTLDTIGTAIAGSSGGLSLTELLANNTIDLSSVTSVLTNAESNIKTLAGKVNTATDTQLANALEEGKVDSTTTVTNTFRIANDKLIFNGVNRSLDYFQTQTTGLSNRFDSVSFGVESIGTHTTSTVPVKIALGITSTTTSSSMTAVIDSVNFVFDGTDLSITTPVDAKMYLAGTNASGASSTATLTNTNQRLYATSGSTFTVNPANILAGARGLLGGAGSVFDVLSAGQGTFQVKMAVSGINFHVSNGSGGTTSASTVTVGSGSDSHFVLSGPGISGNVKLINKTPAELVSSNISSGKYAIRQENLSITDIQTKFYNAYKWAAADSVTTNDQDVSRFLYGLSRLATAGTVASDNASGSFTTIGSVLNGAGCTINGSSFDLTTILLSKFNLITCPKDSNLPDNTPTGNDLKALMKTSVYDELSSVLAILKEVSSTFMTTWTEADFGPDFIEDVDHPNGIEVDYGDVLTLRAWVQFLMGQILINAAYDQNVDLDAVLKANGTTTETHLNNYPNAMKLVDSSTLTTAKTHWYNAATDLKAAIDSIVTETDDQNNDLFEVDTANQEDTKAKAHLTDFQSSLDTATPFSEAGKTLNLDLGQFFAGLDIRAKVPEVTGDDVTDLFPDSRMGGIFPDDTFNFAGTGLNDDPNVNGIPDIFESNGGFDEFARIPSTPTTMDTTFVSDDGSTYYIAFYGSVGEPSTLYSIDLASETVTGSISVDARIKGIVGQDNTTGNLITIGATSTASVINSINPTTGAVVELGSSSSIPGQWVNGTAINSAKDTLYVVTAEYGSSNYTSYINVFSLTNSSFSIGAIVTGNFAPAGVNSSGLLVGTMDDNSGVQVVTVDPTVGDDTGATVLGTISTLNYTYHTAMNRSGTAVYGVGWSDTENSYVITTFNLNTNTHTLTADIPINYHIDTMAPNGQFVAHYRDHTDYNDMRIGYATP